METWWIAKGTAYITSSQINNEHAEHPNDADNQSASSCPACDNCYDFCPDLRNKRANPPGYSIPQIAKWQPDFNLLYTENSNRTIGNLTIATDTGEGVIVVPNNLHLAKFTGNIIGEVLASDKPVLLFLVDKDHHETPVGSPKREVFEEELPQCYNENPHLLNHSAVHFFFQKKLTTGGNLRHLDVRRRNGKLVLVYEIITRSSAAGILYQFRSGEIFGRWELKVRGSNQNTSSLNDMIDGFFGSCGKKFSEGINLPNQSGSGLAAISGFFRLVKAAVMGWVKKQVGSSINEVITGPKMEELMGVKEGKEKGKDKPENEQQVERKTKSTGKNAVEKIVEPSIFYSNTVDFSYDFWEFANRCVANPFMIRFEHSETLYNNLINNNDKSPIQNIQCRFSAFKQAVKVGCWQGKVDLFFDIDNALSSACKNGTFFYDDLEKLFQPWRPKYKTLQSFTHGDTFNTGVAQGQEDVEVTTQTSTTTEELLNADMTNADYGIEDYIGSQDANIWQQMGHRVHAENWGAGGRDCLGCLCGGGSHDNPNYSFKKEYNFTSGGTLTLKTRGSGEQTCEIPGGGGKVVFEAKGNGGSITLETTTTTEHKKYHFKHERIQAEKEKNYEAKEYDEPEWTDDNTASGSNIGETDPEQAEKLKEFDQEREEKSWEDKDKDGVYLDRWTHQQIQWIYHCLDCNKKFATETEQKNLHSPLTSCQQHKGLNSIGSVSENTEKGEKDNHKSSQTQTSNQTKQSNKSFTTGERERERERERE